MLKDHLIRARALIEGGFQKGSLYNASKTCFCIYGALEKTGGDTRATAAKLSEFLPNTIPQHSRELGIYTPLDRCIVFNDDPDTSQADVLDLFDKAIAAS